MPEPTPKPSAAPAAPAAPSGAPLAGPTPIASIDDLIERAEDRRIRRGSTVRLSPDRKDLQKPVAVEELSDSLAACGIKVVFDKSVSGDAIIVEPPAAPSR